MTSKHFEPRRMSAAGIAAVSAVALVVAPTTPAAASTIRDGWVQLCPWGNYRVHLEYVDLNNHTVQLGPVLDPGADCWWGPVPTGGESSLFWVIGHFNTSSGTFEVIGPNRKYETFYNGVTGIGFAAEGTTASGGRKDAHYYRY
ncbi:hypothetical protein [Micromonospora sp. WMMD987]|jgi:hypothetical protein|uniref:hypothetical protein n=1 Tax=Micromonospora sp. WMMD987 TaxID=3016089 RepID=UPI002499EF0E|nr:hypothetical protein [Micromonospora sp. WMMD987]WFE97177.1 hypothetical protein O7612_10065 [Micromonospora sp. WMMD987]